MLGVWIQENGESLESWPLAYPQNISWLSPNYMKFQEGYVKGNPSSSTSIFRILLHCITRFPSQSAWPDTSESSRPDITAESSIVLAWFRRRDSFGTCRAKVLLFNIQVLTVRTLSEFHLHLQHSTHQRCLCKIIPSHSCFTYLRGSVSAKYSPVTFDAVQLLPRSYTTVFDESKFYQPRRTAISRAAGGGGATNIKLTNFKIVYLNRTDQH